MPSLTLTQIRQAGGKVYFRFGKVEREFTNLAAAQAYAESILNRDVMEALVIATVIARQRNISTPALVEGRTWTIDLSLNTFGVII